MTYVLRTFRDNLRFLLRLRTSAGRGINLLISSIVSDCVFMDAQILLMNTVSRRAVSKMLRTLSVLRLGFLVSSRRTLRKMRRARGNLGLRSIVWCRRWGNGRPFPFNSAILAFAVVRGVIKRENVASATFYT